MEAEYVDDEHRPDMNGPEDPNNYHKDKAVTFGKHSSECLPKVLTTLEPVVPKSFDLRSGHPIQMQLAPIISNPEISNLLMTKVSVCGVSVCVCHRECMCHKFCQCVIEIKLCVSVFVNMCERSLKRKRENVCVTCGHDVCTYTLTKCYNWADVDAFCTKSDGWKYLDVAYS